MYQPRPYQSAALRQTSELFAAGHRRVLLWLPTGAGKTVVALLMAQLVLRKGWRIVFVCDRQTLVQQTVNTFESLKVPIGYLWARKPRDPAAPIQVVSAQTLEREQYHQYWHPWHGAPRTLWIVDEAHKCGRRKAMIDVLRNIGDSWAIGLSATITGLTGPVGMADIFDTLVTGPHYSELIASGSLAPVKVIVLDARRRVDFSGLKARRSGEYDDADVAALLMHDAPVRDAMQEGLRQRIDPGPGITFSATVEHAEFVAGVAVSLGLRVGVVTGTKATTYALTPTRRSATRAAIFSAVAAGTLDLICSVDSLCEGFDEPRLTWAVDFQRLVKGRARHVQKMGRIARSAMGKSCAVWIDAVGNVEQPGFGRLIDQPIPTLELARDKRSEAAPSLPPVRLCPQCGTASGIAAPVCEGCGYVYPPPAVQPRGQVDFDGYAAREVTRSDMRVELKEPQLKRLAYAEAALAAYRERVNPSRAMALYRQEWGKWPTRHQTRGAVFGHFWGRREVTAYLAYLTEQARKVGKDITWVQTWLRREFGDEWHEHCRAEEGVQ